MPGIYLHIPFCKTKCPYCDFYSFEQTSSFESYHEAMLKEIELRKDYLEGPVETLYLGGGTPSLFNTDKLVRLIDKIDHTFAIKNDAEITLEANPDDLNLDFCNGLFKTGFNRISMGTQSFHDDELNFLGRRHNVQKNHQALNCIFEAGFENVSIDLIYGLPGSTVDKLNESIGWVMEYPVKHISAYHLTIEPGTPFDRMLKKGIIKEVAEEKSVTLFESLIHSLKTQGFRHYEISNFALEGYYSRHNSNYWKGKSYLGIGPSAHSFNGDARSWNVRDINTYIESINKGIVPREEEQLTEKDKFNEYLMTRLRTEWGADLEEVAWLFGNEKQHYLNEAAKPFLNSGDMKITRNTLFLTNKGKLVSDGIIRELFILENLEL
jgi:oxygen-independent coproporphyrinogen-3 oxidase